MTVCKSSHSPTQMSSPSDERVPSQRPNLHLYLHTHSHPPTHTHIHTSLSLVVGVVVVEEEEEEEEKRWWGSPFLSPCQ